MKKTTPLIAFLWALLLSSHMVLASPPARTHAFGMPITAEATITTPAMQSGHSMTTVSQATSSYRPLLTSRVVLMSVPLTAAQKHVLRAFNRSSTSELPNDTTATLPSRVALGMNNVPVLDQGMHGTCVTFAVTAALDALMNQGDHISQLCNLELGNYLAAHSYLPSGWEGNWAFYLLGRFSEFGIVTMDQQKTQGCAGVSAYPIDDMANTGGTLSIDDYIQMSKDINGEFYWYTVLIPQASFSEDWVRTHQDEKLLLTVKTLLATKNAKASLRLTMGVLLPVEHCSAGACAKHHQADDTWAISKSIQDDQDLEIGGHEMVITGYDDNAIAIDRDGGRHRGLLMLRNSWGSQHGDGGDYYMTYDFFKHFVMEVTVVGKNVED